MYTRAARRAQTTQRRASARSAAFSAPMEPKSRSACVVKRSTGHTHTHTDREQHPRHRHTHTHMTRTTFQIPKRTPLTNTLQRSKVARRRCVPPRLCSECVPNSRNKKTETLSGCNTPMPHAPCQVRVYVPP